MTGRKVSTFTEDTTLPADAQIPFISPGATEKNRRISKANLAAAISTNLSATPSAANVVISSGTGTNATLGLADGTNAGLMAPAEKSKLAGIAAGATAFTDEMVRDVIGAALVAGSGITVTVNDSGDTITLAATGGSLDTEAVQDVVGAMIVAGSGISATYNDAAGTVTLTASGGGGTNATNLTATASSTSIVVASDTGTDATLGLADGTNAGLMAPAQVTKLAVVRTDVVTLTDGATVALDASLGRTFRVTLGGNRTLSAPSNPVDGQVIELEIAQDATGSRTLTLPSGSTGVVWSTDAPSSLFVLSTTASKVDVLTLKYRAGKGWLAVSFLRGF